MQAFAAEARLGLGPVTGDDKSNASAAMPKLLEMLALQGTPGSRYEARRLYLDAPAPADKRQSCQPVDGGHGRLDPRRATVCHELAWLRERHDWPGRAAFGQIAASRATAKRTNPEPRYSLMRAPFSPARVPHAARAQSAIANCLHWVLDVTMHADRQRNRKDHGPETLALLRRLALNLARREPTHDALRGQLTRAAWNDDFLLNLIRTAA